AQAAAQAAYVPPKPIVVTKPYVAPAYVPPKPIVYNAPKSTIAPAPATKTQTQYVDYTGGVAAAAPRAATAATPTNKNLYTGSYQQPSTTYQQYQPKTYTGGASTGATTSYSAGAAATSNAAAGGAGTYIVKKGDTVFEVMRQTGVYWKEIISMNNLQAPSYTIQPGQALRLK
ncbi:MAG: LysM peptidoglycan-binding domain-containing protein, partial [Leucothrix sp.]